MHFPTVFLWQTVSSENGHNKISPLIWSLYNMTLIFLPLKDGVCFLLVNLDRFVTSVDLILCDSGGWVTKVISFHLLPFGPLFGGLGHHCVIKVRATCQATWRGDRGVFWPIAPDEFLGDSQHQQPATSEDTSKWLLPPRCPVIFSSWVLSFEATDITEQKQTAPLCLFWIPDPQNL